MLRQRINSHRNDFNKLCKSDNSGSSPSKGSSLAGHLFCVHKVKNNLHFNVSFKFDILCQTSNSLEGKNALIMFEQYFIKKLGTVHPNDLNRINAISGNQLSN